MKQLLTAIGLSAVLGTGAIAAPALAGPSAQARRPTAVERRPIIVRMASPLRDVMDIDIYPGIGTNISFEGIGETIDTMFLENRSWIGLTTNGSMAGNDTVANTATLIHLSPIDPLSLPGVIETNKKTVQSLLTVMTKDKSGHRKTYLFNLRYTRRSTKAVALVDFYRPQAAPKNPIVNAASMRQEIEASNQERRILVAKLASGLATAIGRGELKNYTPRQIDDIRKTIGMVYQGIPLADAVRQNNADMTTISKLILLGT